MNEVLDYNKYLIALKSELESMINTIQNLNYNVSKNAQWNNLICIISGLRSTIYKELKIIDGNQNLNPISLNIRFKKQTYEDQIISIRLTYNSLIKSGKEYELNTNYDKLY